ncbi:hypothetical protein QTP86_034702, partial [Hemibagrus guttatus]
APAILNKNIGAVVLHAGMNDIRLRQTEILKKDFRSLVDKKGEGIGGPVVGFSPTMRKARVQFPANAQTPATGCSAGPKPRKFTVYFKSLTLVIPPECIVVYCGVLWCIRSVLWCIRSVLWCIVVYCGVLWCIVVYCGVLGVY